MSRKYTRAWVLLPPFIHDRIEERGDLSPDLLIRALQKIQADPNRKDELREVTDRIFDYFKLFPTGWGDWPLDSADCIYVGSIIGASLTGDIDQTLLEMSEEQLAFLDDYCREAGLETEEGMIDLFVDSREE